MKLESFIAENKEVVEQIGEENFYYQTIEDRMMLLKQEGYSDEQVDAIKAELIEKAKEYFDKEKKAKESIKNKFNGYLDRLAEYSNIPRKLKKVARLILIAKLVVGSITGSVIGTKLGHEIGSAINEIKETVTETYVEAEIETLSERELELYNSIWREVGSGADRILLLESIKDPDERKRLEKVDLRIENFNEMFTELGIQDVEMDEVLGTFPIEFLSNMNSISFENIHKKVNTEKYGEAYANEEIAGEADSGDRSVKIFAGALGNEKIWITNDLIAHELAHLNDWETNKLLTLEERLELFNKILERVDAEDKYQSSYVESITNDNKQYEKHTKAKEYYAEIMEAYFSINGPMSLPEADRAVVKGVIDKLNPQYDENAMLSVRLGIITESASASPTS
jgi:hypothetical protein